MDERKMIPNIPESVWSAISDKLYASRWSPDVQPESRIDALVQYCNWYFETFGEPD